jgi:acyl-CoA thioesterase FadM
VSGDVVTSWGLVLRWERATAADARSVITIEGVFADARTAYLGRCAVLAAFLRDQEAEVRVEVARPGTAFPADTFSADAFPADGALVGVSVVEVRPSSFDMAVRIRPAGAGDVAPVNLRRTMVVERTTTGERLEIPREVRAEFIALQLSAGDLC